MILTHDDLSAIEHALGPEHAAPIINAFEKLEREQKVEVKKDLLLEPATRADIADLRTELFENRAATRTDIANLRTEVFEIRGATRADIAELRGEIKRVEAEIKVLLKVLIGLSILAMGLFSPAGVELIKLIK